MQYADVMVHKICIHEINNIIYNIHLINNRTYTKKYKVDFQHNSHTVIDILKVNSIAPRYEFESDIVDYLDTIDLSDYTMHVH